MTSTSRASSSIIAAGIFAILGGVLGALFNLAALILFSFSKFPPGAIYPDFMRPVLYVIWTFGLFCAVFLFGHFFRGPPALIFVFLSFALLIIPGVGLLLLKRWSYPLTIASQLLVCANGLAATFSPTYTEMVRSVLAGMNLPELAPTAEQMVNYSRTFNLLSLTIPIAILITLLVVHRQFFAAADNALSDGTVAIPR